MLRKMVALILMLPLIAFGEGQKDIFTGHRRVNPITPVAGVVQHCLATFGVLDCVMPGDVTAGDVLIFFSFNNEFSAIPQTPNGDLRCGSGVGFWHTLQSGIPGFFTANVLSWCQATSTGPDTIHIASVASTSFMVIEVNGVPASSPIDTSATITSSTTTTTVTNSITTSVANDLILSFESYEYGTTDISASSGWAWAGGDGLSSAVRPINGFSKLATAPGSYGVTLTNNNAPQSRTFASTMVAIKPR